MAITNSAAVFLDAAGNDSYSTTEESFSPGGARPARGFGNLALFVDGEGRDSYSGPLGRDSTVWSRSIYGMGYDAPLDVERPREAAIEITLAPEDTQRTIEEIFDDAALWEVTDNREKVRRARMALIALGTRAVAWVAENKLDTRSGLERRAIIELFEEYPDSSLPHLKSAFENGNKDTRKNVLVLFGKLKPTSVTELLLDKLHDNEFTTLRPSILSVLGDIGDTTAAPMIVHFATSKIERERIASVRALGNLKHPPAYDAIFERLSDEPFTVRSAAAFAIAAQDEQVLPAIESRVEMREIESLEGMMLAVGMLAHRWSADEGLQKSVRKLMPIVRRYLEHPSPRVLGAAIVAASEVMNEKSFRKVQKRFSKSDEPVVRARLSQAALKYQSQ